MTDPADPDLLAQVPTDPLVYAQNCVDRVRRSAARMAESNQALDAEIATGRAKRAYTAAQLGAMMATVSIAADLRRLADLAETWAVGDPPVMLVQPPT